MSGIGGIICFDARPVEEQSLDAMASRLTHRGPDATSTWRHACVGLVHTLLRTTPEALSERQPLVGNRGSIALVADARIDNRDELRRALSISVPEISSTSDSELILAAYRKWGEMCVDRLIGDFAFALWDDQEHKLFCARDRIGVRPFYYWHCAHQGFAFASEVKALLVVPSVPSTLDTQCITSFLADRVESDTRTFYAAISGLAPAHTLTVKLGLITTRCYWKPNENYELRLRNDHEYAEAFLELFKESVRCRLRSISPIAVALSGGVDSSSVACVARNLSTRRDAIRVFSAVYNDSPTADERPFAHQVVQSGGFDPHYVNVRDVSPLESLDAILYHEDGPFDNPLFSGGWHFRSAIQQESVRVLLDGHGGDSTLSYDFNYLTELARRLRFITLMRESTGLSAHYFQRRVSSHRVAWTFGVRPIVSWIVKRRPPPPPVRTAHCQMICHPVFGRDLETANKANAAFQIEARHPFLDTRLVEFCISLPREQRVKNGWTRIILRRALNGILPAAVQWRGSKWTPNRYFSDSLFAKERETMLTFFHVELARWKSALDGWGVDIPELRTTFERYVRDRKVKDAYRVWAVIVLCRWLAGRGGSLS